MNTQFNSNVIWLESGYKMSPLTHFSAGVWNWLIDKNQDRTKKEDFSAIYQIIWNE